MTHAERVKMIRLACSWIAFFILLPTFIVICVVTRRDDRFSLHKNLILAFILYILTLFIYYYGKLEEDLSRKMVCNAFWLLNLFFKAAEITWMLNESIFLVRMLLYSLDDDFYLWYYLLFGWGFSGFLTFCVYLPYLQFKIGRDSERCWVSHRHTNHVLMLHIPLTIILVINFGFAIYIVRLLAIKRRHSQTRHMKTLLKSVKFTVILVFFLGFIDLVVFYQPENSPGYDWLVALLDPFQVAIEI
ncbi:PREDICTED: calcitonin receptor-like [Acropora digitifera]|uniref:calcitonin receptor-like n=1 Tax=Acropora digitifera TaxID=70779 RepID=UPI00077A50D1|nr:PREDICTED: calcitonin receptor-like [Acropora digitifera]XP_015764402.1 PREDICTED: calcitonin receptor-like [Acropora digitifera]